MPLFDWVDALAFLDWGPGSPSRIIRREIDGFEAEVDDPAAGPLSRDRQELARLLASAAMREESEEAKLERSRWLEANHAERSFPCGIVPDPVLAETHSQALTPLRPMQVIAAVLPNDLVFIREQSEGVHIDEVGRLPREAIRDVDVVDDRGGHVPDPTHETIEPTQLVLMVLRWENEGADDEDRFAFRSPWLAWQAGRKLLEARRT